GDSRILVLALGEQRLFRHLSELVKWPIRNVAVDGDLRITERTNDDHAFGPSGRWTGEKRYCGCQRARSKGPPGYAPKVGGTTTWVSSGLFHLLTYRLLSSARKYTRLSH